VLPRRGSALDRQPEFTQIDVEMSFVNQDDVFRVMEGLIFRSGKRRSASTSTLSIPQRALSADAVRGVDGKYGNDKPDLRFGLEHVDLTDLVIEHGGGGVRSGSPSPTSSRAGKYRRDLPAEIVKALRIPAELAAKLSRAELDKLEEFVKGMGFQGARAREGRRRRATGCSRPLAKTITPELRRASTRARGAKERRSSLFQFGRESSCRR
jgi:aspartyl-tRNA synthetase